MTADLSALIARLEAAEVGSRELDWLIAKSLFGFSMWKSKHGHWNINWPDDWPFSSRPLHCSVPGRSPDEVFDAQTGHRLPPEIEPVDWLEDIECPLWTTSLDATLALAERVGLQASEIMHLAWSMMAKKHSLHCCFYAGSNYARDAAIQGCIAILRAKQGEGE